MRYNTYAMADNKNRGGGPWLTIEQKAKRKELLLLKIQPHLMTGLSVDKALTAAKIHNSEFYKYMSEDRLFGEQVASFKNYIPVLVCKIFATELMEIAKRQKENHSKGLSLSKQDINFVMWFAVHSNLTIEEYGKRIKSNYFDPEAEIQKVESIIEQATTEEIYNN